MPIFRWTNCIITASAVITLCKRLYSMPDESRLQSSLLSSGILYSVLWAGKYGTSIDLGTVHSDRTVVVLLHKHFSS